MNASRLGAVLGAVALLGHAVPAALYANKVLSLPIEAGGMFFGPFIGLPALCYAVATAAGAVMLLVAPDVTRGPATQVLLVTVFLDVVLAMGGTWNARLVLGALLAFAALVLLVWDALPRVRDWR